MPNDVVFGDLTHIPHRRGSPFGSIFHSWHKDTATGMLSCPSPETSDSPSIRRLWAELGKTSPCLLATFFWREEFVFPLLTTTSNCLCPFLALYLLIYPPLPTLDLVNGFMQYHGLNSTYLPSISLDRCTGKRGTQGFSGHEPIIWVSMLHFFNRISVHIVTLVSRILEQ